MKIFSPDTDVIYNRIHFRLQHQDVSKKSSLSIRVKLLQLYSISFLTLPLAVNFNFYMPRSKQIIKSFWKMCIIRRNFRSHRCCCFRFFQLRIRNLIKSVNFSFSPSFLLYNVHIELCVTNSLLSSEKGFNKRIHLILDDDDDDDGNKKIKKPK